MKLKEEKKDKCVVCGKEIQGYGNNAEPLKKGRCCDKCNAKVILARLKGVTDLKEDFSSNMPYWLYNTLKSQYGRTLRDNLLRKGINLSNVKVTVRSVPSSAEYKQLTANNVLPILLLDHNTVYIPGINNDETYEINGRYRHLGNVSIETLLSKATSFGYIDLNNPDNLITNLKQERKLAKQGAEFRGKGQWQDYPTLKDSKGYTIFKNNKPVYDKTNSTWLTSSKLDKSGYALPDPDKYAKKLDNVGLSDYGVRLKSYYKKLTDLKNNIIDRIISLDITDSESSQTSRKLRNALSNLDDAANGYRELTKSINRVLDKDISDQAKDQKIHDIFSEDAIWSGLTDLRKYLRYTKQELGESVKKKKRAQGYFVKMNSGNPEKNQEMFNNAMGNSEATNAAEGEGMAEELDLKDLNLNEAKINIRDSLMKIDIEDYRDLLNLYDAIKPTDDEKRKIALHIVKIESPSTVDKTYAIDQLEKYLNNLYDKETLLDDDTQELVTNADINVIGASLDKFEGDYDYPYNKDIIALDKMEDWLNTANKQGDVEDKYDKVYVDLWLEYNGDYYKHHIEFDLTGKNDFNLADPTVLNSYISKLVFALNNDPEDLLGQFIKYEK